MPALAQPQYLSQRVLRLEESATIAMAKKGRELAAAGHDVINLSFGEPDFDTPIHIREAAKLAIDEGYSHYPPVAGYPDLRRAICEKFERENGLHYQMNQIVVSTGAKQAIANAVLSLADRGDEVLILGPYWVSYVEMVRLAGATPVVVPGAFERNFKPDMAELEAAITERTKLLMFSAPSNPCGTVFNDAEMAELAAVLRRHPQVFAIADEIYEHINYGGRHLSLAAQPGMAERTVTVNGLSKAFAMTGWRLGYIGAPATVAYACEKMQGQFTSGANTIAQRAAIAALNGGLQSAQAMTARFKARRDACLAALRQIPGLEVHTPEAAFYLFPRVSSFYGKRTPDGQTITGSQSLAEYLLQTQYVSLVAGDAFGDDDCIRISFAAEDGLLAKAMGRIAEGLAKLL